MVKAIQYRGPDHQGVWADEKSGTALAHQRLSIIDCSPNGYQPMCSSNQRYVMVYNGEVYNFNALRKQLIQKGERFQGHSDSEVLIAAFCCWGVDKTLEKINGMFAIALFDRQLNQLYLIRDRLGQKPLYYGKQGRYFFFASELKALQQHPKFQVEINRNAVASLHTIKFCACAVVNL